MAMRPAEDNEPLRSDAKLYIDALFFPSFRQALAIQDGVNRNLLMTSWGGIGDEICAEPTLRYALKTFINCEISLISRTPELFTHLKFKEIFRDEVDIPKWENYLILNTAVPTESPVTEFFAHMLTNCLDFPPMSAFRMQLPVADRAVILPLSDWQPDFNGKVIAIHPGRHWPSKTFPPHWWNGVIEHLRGKATLVIIGADSADGNQGTVNVNTKGCIDLRNKLKITDSITLLNKYTDVLLTNDSSPLHMAAPGKAWIGFMATCKHPDYITHWRNPIGFKPEWGWRMENLSKGGIWEVQDYCPNQGDTTIRADLVDKGTLLSWLPDPKEVAEWALARL